MRPVRILVAAFMALLFATTLHAQIPTRISYQGIVTDPSGRPIDGKLNVTISLYTSESARAAAWSESKSIDATRGVFNTLLGSETRLDIPFDRPYWLGISVDGGAELKPRTELAAVPYALAAPIPTFVHTVQSGNSIPVDGVLSSTLLDNPLVNDAPDVTLIVTQRVATKSEPGLGTLRIVNEHPVGVEYDATIGRWIIFNIDGAEMPDGAAFNVLVSRQ